jgi:hypothetical protein
MWLSYSELGHLPIIFGLGSGVLNSRDLDQVTIITGIRSRDQQH